MPILPIRHFEWQVLRTVKRSKTPPNGRDLRLIPSRRTKDGSFLTELVEQGLLTCATGTTGKPFDATYALTEKGEYAAEYGECELPMPTAGPPKSEPATSVKKRKGSRGK